MRNEALFSFPVVVLAAGRGRRAGVPKWRVPFQGRFWLEKQLDCLRVIGFKDIFTVFSEDELYRAQGMDCVVVSNPLPEQGQFSSLQRGLEKALKLSPAGLFVLPVDVPCPQPVTWEMLRHAFSPAASAHVPTLPNGRGGHPVLLSTAFASYLCSLHPTARLDHEIAALKPELVQRIGVWDPNVARNHNTPADFRWHERGGAERV